tara:strand:- start:12405 stop:15620 length:3216 start_codon:yes stop_codon:yes gene_type:complete
MPLISGTIPSLINGVSQQPATLRMPTQGEVQENGFSHITRGLEKRPCTEHVANVGVNSTNANDVYIHTIRRSEDEAYAFICKGGELNADGSGTGMTTEPSFKLIDLTGFATGTAGNEVFIQPDNVASGTNVTQNGTIVDDVKKYLCMDNGVTFTPNKFSTTTVADFSFILNKDKKVKKATDTHADQPYESMAFVKIGDYDANYKVVVTQYDVDADGEIDHLKPIWQYEVNYKTPNNNTESRTDTTSQNTLSINNQAGVVVSTIAKTLYEGAIQTQKVHIVKQGGTTEPDKLIISTTSTDGTSSGTARTAYTGKFGVRDHGEITTRKRTYNSGNSTWSSWSTLSGASNVGLKNIENARPSSGNGSATDWTISDPDNGSVLSLQADYHETNSYPFTIECTDGKGDSNIVAINGSDEVPSFGKLPGTGIPENFVAKVSGDRGSGQDDYYVIWNGSVWKETFRPKYSQIPVKRARSKVDNKTMPIQLYKAFDASNDIYFVMKLIDYPGRTVGDDLTNPFPSFADYEEGTNNVDDALYTINDIFFHRNRLGFISDENVILSEAANYFNFFANTVLSVLDTSVIDVAVSNNQVAILKSAIPFQESLLLFSDLQQFKLTSDDFLTPTSVAVDVATNFETSTEAKPVPAGKTIFFPFQRGAFSGIREYMIDVASETNDANEVTSHVPEFITGTVKKMAVSSNEELLCVLSDTDRRDLFIYKYYYNDQEKLQSSWSKWKFDGQIVDMEFIGSTAYILFRRGVAGASAPIYLERLNLSTDNATSIMDDRIGVRLDRRVKLEWGGTTDSNGNPTNVPTVDSYYTDENFDVVGTNVLTNGADQKGDRLSIDGVTTPPRLGQTFTIDGRANITYTVTNVGPLSGNALDIEFTPTIPAVENLDNNQAGPVGDNVALTFEQRKLEYVTETGEVVDESKVATILTEGTTFSQGKGNTSPIIFAGIPYDFKYTFSEQFVKSGDDSINSGRLQMRNFEISYDKTGFFEIEVAPKPFDDRQRKIFTRQFTAKQVGSLVLGKQPLLTGVFRVPVYVSSKDVRITVSSDSWLPLSLQSADYEAYQVLRNQRI